MYKLKSLNIDIPPFRKLKNVTIDFAERITLIAGHNGIGKSTILALIANGSGLTDKTFITYTGRTFQGNLNEIIHIDYEGEFEGKDKSELPRPILRYDLDGHIFEKRCALTKRTRDATKNSPMRHEVRVVPRNNPSSEYRIPDSDVVIGDSSKVPIPTIYLGMTRMLPIGETDPDLIENIPDTDIHPEDAAFINDFVNRVIGASLVDNGNAIITQGIKGTPKRSKHPVYSHSAKTVSLGQDSLSSIATALASFMKIRREWGDGYPGGLLVVDEIDAGFHPHAQKKLIQGISTAARHLQLQVVATTHSLPLIESIHPDSQQTEKRGPALDKVVYIRDTRNPTISELTLYEIQNDMHLVPPKAKMRESPKKLKVYLEDAEANLFFKSILNRRLQREIKSACSFSLKPIPISIGCNNLQDLQKFDPHFKSVVIVVDADAVVARGLKNVAKLPGGRDQTGKCYNPERTIFEFAKSLVENADLHPSTWERLREIRVTSNIIQEYLLDGDFNITKRESAKKWMNARKEHIENWELVPLWLKENADEVRIFEKALINAAVTAAKLNQ